MRLLIAYLFVCSFLIPDLAQAQKGDPGILFSTLLNEMQMLYEKGKLRINYLTAVNLPAKQAEGDTAKYVYTPKGTPGLTSIIKYDGYEEDFATLYWYGAKQTEPFWMLEKYDVKKNSQPKAEDGWMVFQTPGNFNMEFYSDDDLIYTFPFTVSKLPAVEGGDPLDKYFLDGPWEDYCYLFYLGGIPSMNIKLVIWLRNKERRPTKNVKVLGILMKDGAPVAKTSEGPMELTLTPEWQRFELPIGSSMRDNEGKLSFKNLKASNILGAPGNFELMITVDNQLYGLYPFTVEETGQFRLIAEQDPERTPAKTRIHAGKDMIWLKRNKK